MVAVRASLHYGCLVDVRWFGPSPRERRVAAQVADAAGERRELIEADRAERVLAAAGPLVDALAAGAEGRVHTLAFELSERPRPTLVPLVQAVARAIVN